MANISEMISNELKDKALQFFLGMMRLCSDVVKSKAATARMNDETETMNHFLKRFNEYYDQSTGKPKNPNAPLPFDVSFYNGDSDYQVLKILNKEGIHHMEFTNGKNRFIITDNDAKTRKIMNDIRFGNREEIKNKTVSARMDADAFSERFSSQKMISVNGLSKTQLNLFDALARKNKFFYAVQINDGAYTISVTKDDYENPANNLKNMFRNIAIKAGAGIDAQYSDIFNRRQRMLATEAMERLWKQENKDKENYIYIDEKNPSHYIVVSENKISVFNGEKNYDIIKDGKNDPAEYAKQLNAEIKSMKDAAQISHSDYIALYQKSPMDAETRKKFAGERAELSKLNTSSAIFSSIGKIAEKHKNKINQKEMVYNHTIRRLTRVLELNKRLAEEHKDTPNAETFLKNIENAQKALEQMERIKASGESIEAINAIRSENNPLIMVTELNTLASLTAGELPIREFMNAVMLNEFEEQAISDDKNEVLTFIRDGKLVKENFEKFVETVDVDASEIAKGKSKEFRDDFASVFANACHNFVIGEIRTVSEFKNQTISGEITPDDISDNILKTIKENLPEKHMFSDILIDETLEEMKEVYNEFAVEEHSAAIADIEINDFKIREEFIYDATKDVGAFYKDIFDNHADERDAARGDEDER